MKLLPANPIHIKLPDDWKYIPSGSTDIRKSFRKERARLASLEKLKPMKIREFKKNEKSYR